MRRWALPFSFCFGVGLVAHSVFGAALPPLSEIVKTPIAECKQTSSVKVPVITWGGDMATVYANGNKIDTAQGSIFESKGLSLKLFHEDVLAKQLEAYLKCDSPYIRGTMGMITMAAQVTERDPRTKMVVAYQMTWSFGGDALTIRDTIKKPEDLRGKTIAIQAYGPHVDYLTTVLNDAGLSVNDVTIRWTKDLAGLEGDTPGKVFHDDPSIAAAFVIIPDALALTKNGTVGDGGEDSVRGAKILLSTKTARYVIADVYAVRQDYFDANRDKVQQFVHGLMIGNERLQALVREKTSRTAEYQQMISAGANILLDSPQATAEALGMYTDADFVGWKGNVQFFGNQNHPKYIHNLSKDVQGPFISLGLLGNPVTLGHARFDYNALKAGLTDTSGVEAPRFDTAEVAKVVAKRQQQGTLNEAGLFKFEVAFGPNQKSFSADLYEQEFDEVIKRATTYGGAVITVEGHSDSMEYLRSKKDNAQANVLGRIKQSAKNLSLSRANEVRDNIIAYAKQKGINLDPSQFAVVGHGIMSPKTGKMCGDDPCPPQTEQEWRNNMRVEFRFLQVEAESQVFKPL